jgi:hypothetical protein
MKLHLTKKIGEAKDLSLLLRICVFEVLCLFFFENVCLRNPSD